MREHALGLVREGVRRFRPELRASEAHRGARSRRLGRNAARLDDGGPAVGSAGAAHAAEPAAAPAASLPSAAS